MARQNITVQTNSQGNWDDGMVKTTASQVIEEENKRFATAHEKEMIGKIPERIRGILLAGQSNLNNLYVSEDPVSTTTKTIKRHDNSGVDVLMYEDGAEINVLLIHGHDKSSLILRMQDSTPYAVRYFGSTNHQSLSLIPPGSVINLIFVDGQWSMLGATDMFQLVGDKLSANAPITAGTATKITYDEKGLVISGTTLTQFDIPSIQIEKVIGLQEAIDEISDPQIIIDLEEEIKTKMTANDPIVPGTHSKITYDDKGLVISGADLTAADIPQLSVDKIEALQDTLDQKLSANPEITPGAGYKVTYDEKGLVLGATTSLLPADIPELPVSKITNLQQQLDEKLTMQTTITPATATKITYDQYGLVTHGSNIEAADIPNIAITQVTGLTQALEDIGSAEAIEALREEVNQKLTGNTPITPGIATKVTYDEKGLVTDGTSLTATDIPVLPVEKITGLVDVMTDLYNTDGSLLGNYLKNRIVAGDNINLAYDSSTPQGIKISSTGSPRGAQVTESHGGEGHIDFERFDPTYVHMMIFEIAPGAEGNTFELMLVLEEDEHTLTFTFPDTDARCLAVTTSVDGDIHTLKEVFQLDVSGTLYPPIYPPAGIITNKHLKITSSGNVNDITYTIVYSTEVVE